MTVAEFSALCSGSPRLGSSPALRRKPRRSPILLSAAVLVTALAGPALAEEFRGKVVGVADGDTISVMHGSRAEKIRLNGIDAPEDGQAFSKRAKEFTSGLAFGQVVTVRAKDVDRYGRTIADVILPDGRSLNQEMVRAGFAWWFQKYSKDQTLAALETEARAGRRGLWADPNPIPPWEWRQAQRAPILAPQAPRAPAFAPSSPAPTAPGPIIGNKRSGIYHRPDCPNYADVSPQNRVPFATPTEAEAAGFRVARNCP